jgi:hypothetical protein
MRRNGPYYPMSPGTGVPFSTTVGLDLPSAKQTWGTIFAAWLLLRQPNIAQVSEEQVSDGPPRAGGRKGGSTAPRQRQRVRVVDLAQREARSESGRGGYKVSKRTLVGAGEGGFWRDQACGPRWTLRERIWIEEFWRGPADGEISAEPIDLVRRLK